MSEFPFAGPEPQQAPPAPRDRRTVLVAAGLVAVLAAGGGAYLLLGQDSAVDAGPVAAATARAGTAVPAATPAATPSPAVVPVVAAVKDPRNPFKALVVEETAASTDGTSTGGTSTGGSSTDGSADATPPAGSSPTTTASPTATQTSKAYPLKLVKIDESFGPGVPLFTWKVGGADVQTFLGQRFGPDGELTVLMPIKEPDGTYSGAVVQVGTASPETIAIGATAQVG